MTSYTKTQLDATRILLQSQLPSDVLQGISLLFNILETNLEDKELFQFVIDIPKKFPESTPHIIDILNRLLAVHESQIAKQTLIELQNRSETSQYIDKLMLDADDAYYSGEYDKAIEMYSRTLKLDPANARAKEKIEKAKINSYSNRPGSEKLHREAIQFYRRARSYLAAKDYQSAERMLHVALESAESSGTDFPEAETLLESLDSWKIAAEYKEAVAKAIAENDLQKALEFYDRIVNLDPTDSISSKTREDIKGLLIAQGYLELLELKTKEENLALRQEIYKTLDSISQNPLLSQSRTYTEIIEKLRKKEADKESKQFIVSDQISVIAGLLTGLAALIGGISAGLLSSTGLIISLVLLSIAVAFIIFLWVSNRFGRGNK